MQLHLGAPAGAGHWQELVPPLRRPSASWRRVWVVPLVEVLNRLPRLLIRAFQTVGNSSGTIGVFVSADTVLYHNP